MESKGDGNKIKIYIITGSSGEWDDYRVHNELCYMNKEKAEADVIRFNKELDEYKIQCAKDIENYSERSDEHCSECKAYNCDDCEFDDSEIDYNYDEHHGYVLQEIDLVL